MLRIKGITKDALLPKALFSREDTFPEVFLIKAHKSELDHVGAPSYEEGCENLSLLRP